MIDTIIDTFATRSLQGLFTVGARIAQAHTRQDQRPWVEVLAPSGYTVTDLWAMVRILHTLGLIQVHGTGWTRRVCPTAITPAARAALQLIRAGRLTVDMMHGTVTVTLSDDADAATQLIDLATVTTSSSFEVDEALTLISGPALLADGVDSIVNYSTSKSVNKDHTNNPNTTPPLRITLEIGEVQEGKEPLVGCTQAELDLGHTSQSDTSSSFEAQLDFGDHSAPTPVPPPPPPVAPSRKPKYKARAVPLAAIRAVFEEWQRVMGYPDRRLTEKRRGTIAARLSEGFTLDQFVTVLTWAVAIPFFRGHNKHGVPYDDIPNLFGSPDKFERNLTRATTTFGDGTSRDPRKLMAADDPDDYEVRVF